MNPLYRILLSTKDWTSFFKNAANLTKKEKGDLFEKLTELILKTKPIYRSKYKNVWLLSEGIDVKLQKKINLPRADEGIDLIAESHTGSYCAIQCKFKGANEAPTRKDIATFLDLSRNHCKNITEQILVHTGTNGIKKTSLLPDSFTQVGLDFWATLTNEDWEAVQRELQNKTAPPSKSSPRKHQAEAIDASTKYFVKDGNKRGKLIMPCGTGKSLTAYWIAESLESKSTIVAVPSLALIKQSLEDWTKEMIHSKRSNLPDWICICSDESTGKITDDFVIDTYSLGIPTTTNTNEIHKFLKADSIGGKIIFTTYQSAEKLAQVSRKIKYKFDLAILDEAHKTVGNTEKSFSTLLKDSAIAIDKRLFMTATERVVKGATENVLSMDDNSIYGSIFYKLSFKKAIEQNIITDYRIVTVLINDNELNELVQKNRYLSDKKRKIDEAESQMLTTALALKKAISEYGISHTVSFHKSITAAKDFQTLYQKIDFDKKRSEVYHISSKINAGDRSKLLKEFKNTDKAIITNARCLTEGVDVPAIDCILFADGKKSIIDIVQASGRALRKFTNKTTGKEKELGYIVIPAVLKEGESLEDLALSDRFKTIIRIVASLSTQDETIAETYRLIESGKKSSKDLKIKFLGSIPEAVDINIEELSKKLTTAIWANVGRIHYRDYIKAKEYVHKLNIKNKKDWELFCNSGLKPSDIPSKPDYQYLESGWTDWGDWLGKQKFLPFNEARIYAHSLRLKNQNAWHEMSNQRPSNIPSNPQNTYKNSGWKGWGDWLGNNNIHKKNRLYLSFTKARAFVRSLNLRNSLEWNNYCKSGKKPDNIPSDPRYYEGRGYKDLADWIGKEGFLPFKKARTFVHQLGLSSTDAWIRYSKSKAKPDFIPADPRYVYLNKGWKGMADWLGK